MVVRTAPARHFEVATSSNLNAAPALTPSNPKSSLRQNLSQICPPCLAEFGGRGGRVRVSTEPDSSEQVSDRLQGYSERFWGVPPTSEVPVLSFLGARMRSLLHGLLSLSPGRSRRRKATVNISGRTGSCIWNLVAAMICSHLERHVHPPSGTTGLYVDHSSQYLTMMEAPYFWRPLSRPANCCQKGSATVSWELVYAEYHTYQ